LSDIGAAIRLHSARPRRAGRTQAEERERAGDFDACASSGRATRWLRTRPTRPQRRLLGT